MVNEFVQSSDDHGAGNPGWRDRAKILSEKEAAQYLNFSRDTLRRMSARGEGPKRLKLSPGRVGYRLGDVLDFIDGAARAS
jgi:predicted DNA-binding transcriptional regulator AlpA